MQVRISRLAQGIKPYVPGEQPKDKKYVKLNTNENPYPPSEEAVRAMRRAAGADLRLYPDPEASELCEAIARVHGLPSENVFVGNGSDEVLAIAFQALFDPGNPILMPDISYSFYPVYASLYRLDTTLIPLDEDFSLPVEKFLRPSGGVVFANPNAPTSRAIPVREVRRIAQAQNESATLVDEAYVAFGAQTAAPDILEYGNLLVVRTLSKSHSLAGLRVGYALGQRELIDAMRRVKNSFNSYTLDRVAIFGAAAAIADIRYTGRICRRIMSTREWVTERLLKMDFEVQPSSANFLFIRHPQWDGKALFLNLRLRGVLVRHFPTPRIKNHLRVSVGSDEEMLTFLSALEEILHLPPVPPSE